jgi:ABC-type transport system substrate-binding protein
MFAPTSRIDAVRLVRNPFARLACDIDEIAFTVYPPDKDGTPRALLKALDDGEVDFTTMLSRSDVANVKGVRKLFQPSNSTAILYLNSERPRLNDVRVRRAIALGLDRVALAGISYSNALAFTANGLLPPAMGASRDALPFDRAAALRLLSEAGVTGGRLRLVAVWAPRPYLPNPQPVADAIAQQLGALGFSVDVTTPKGPEEFFDVLAGWIADTPDPADFLEVNLRSDRVPAARATSASAVNRGRLRDKTMDDALRRFREQPTPAHRDEVMRLTAELCPLLPLLHGPNVVVHAFGVHEVDVSIQGVPWFHTGRLDP